MDIRKRPECEGLYLPWLSESTRFDTRMGEKPLGLIKNPYKTTILIKKPSKINTV